MRSRVNLVHAQPSRPARRYHRLESAAAGERASAARTRQRHRAARGDRGRAALAGATTCSPAPTAVASAPLRSTPCSAPPSSTVSTLKPGCAMCSRTSPITPSTALMTSCPGTARPSSHRLANSPLPSGVITSSGNAAANSRRCRVDAYRPSAVELESASAGHARPRHPFEYPPNEWMTLFGAICLLLLAVMIFGAVRRYLIDRKQQAMAKRVMCWAFSTSRKKSKGKKPRRKVDSRKLLIAWHFCARARM